MGTPQVNTNNLIKIAHLNMNYLMDTAVHDKNLLIETGQERFWVLGTPRSTGLRLAVCLGTS